MGDPDFDEYQLGLAVGLMPERLRLDMARAACVLIADELLRGQVVDASRSWRKNGPPHVDASTNSPPSLHDPEFACCLDWLMDEAGALSAEDVTDAWELRRRAADIASGLGDVILSGGVRTSLIDSAARLLRKLGVFWARLDMEIQGIDQQGIADDDISSGPSLFLDTAAHAVREI